MSKIFPKIYLKFDLKCFNSIIFKDVVTKQMNSNMHYITTFYIPCNIHSYSDVITITIYPCVTVVLHALLWNI